MLCVCVCCPSSRLKRRLPGCIAGYCGFDLLNCYIANLCASTGIDSSGWVLQHAEVGRALSGSLLVGQLLTNQFRASTATARSSLIIAGVSCRRLAPLQQPYCVLFVEIPVPAFGAGRSAVPHLPLAISLHPQALMNPKFECHHTLPMGPLHHHVFFSAPNAGSRRSENKQPELCNALQQSFRVQLALVPKTI